MELGERVIRALNGLFGQLDGRAAMVRRWHQEVRRLVETLPLPAAEREWVEDALVPAMYLRRRLSLARDAVERGSLGALWGSLRAKVESSSPWSGWEEGLRRRVLELSEVCVLLFPRSTSMLEGHNGQDALCQQQRHAISDAFRAARLVVRNDVIQRADGTAAERLFVRRPGDLIECLCERVELPDRGRLTKRRAPQPRSH